MLFLSKSYINGFKNKHVKITYFYIRFDVSNNKEKRFELEFFGDY